MADPSPPASGRYAFNPQPTARIPNADQTDDTRSDSHGATARSGFAGLGGGQFTRPSGPVLAVAGVSLALLAGVLWFGRSNEPNETRADALTTVVADPAAPTAASEADAVVSNVRAVLDGLGLSGVVVDERNGTIHIGGPVPTQTDYDAGVAAARAVAGDFPIDISALVVYGDQAAADGDAAPAAGRSEALQLELDRLLAANPLIFGSGQAGLTELHQRILNNAVLVLTAYPGLEVTIAGFTDEQGDDASNQGLSLSRAENVKAYLVDQGIPADSLQVKAIGEQTTSGSEALARLERRVEFEVTGAGSAAASDGGFRVAIVAPSASNDLAFTQSMVDAVNVLATEMGIEVAVTDNTFVPDEAAAAVRLYAEQDFDLVIAHGSQFGAALIEIAPQFPETAFAWGTASDTFGLPNVYAYDAAAQEGGYVLGALASMLSTSKVTGVVGPIEVGDAAQYINGFEAGARAEDPSTDVLVSYTGSFSDIALATETAEAHIGAGADVLTGSAQMVVGAISTAEQQGVPWFGTQANQASLAPANVVASQVYHWEVALRPILADITAGTLAGTTYTANLANGGLIIEYNPDYPLSPETRQRADELTAAIASGSITPPAG
jgi:basic membrane protein A